MFLFAIEAFSVTASFRIPENHTFQKTLPLPPVTTMTGMMGAALGIDFQSALQYRKDNNILFGVTGTHLGEMKDLWKYNKVKSINCCKDVLIREYITDFSIKIAIGSDNQDTISRLQKAFLNPVYPLTAGNSDDLMKIKRVSKIIKQESKLKNSFENILLPGNHLADYKTSVKLDDMPITYSIKAPHVFCLPTDFNFKGMERRVKKRDFFTFVGSPIEIKRAIPTYQIEGVDCVLL